MRVGVRVKVSEGESEGEVETVLFSSKVTSTRSCLTFLDPSEPIDYYLYKLAIDFSNSLLKISKKRNIYSTCFKVSEDSIIKEK